MAAISRSPVMRRIRSVNDTNRTRDIYVHDMLAGTNILVSAATNGMAPGSGSVPSATDERRWTLRGVLQHAGDLVAGDSNQLPDVFRRDLDTGTTALVSIGTNGGARKQMLGSPADERRRPVCLFYSQAGNLAKVTSPPLVENLFLRDLQLAKTTAITTNNATLGDFVVRMSKDGKAVA